MTATPTTTTDVPGGERSAREPRARFCDLVAAEWIKHRSLRSTWIAYGAAALAVISFNAGTAYDTYSHWTPQMSKDRAAFERDGIALQEAFTPNAALLMALALGAIGALVIVGEYSTGTNRTTFAAVPARCSVMAAKAAVVSVVTTVFGMVVAGVSFAVTQAILDRRGAGVSIGDPGAFRLVLASALLAPVCALSGLALGAVIRHTASTMITSVVVILVLPLILTEGRHWSAVAGHTLPYRAWLRLVDVNYSPIAFPWSTGGAWTVYAVWACAACAVAVTSVHLRDQ
ncbi:ABC transporter permease subunit [Streptomyces sp. NPDC057539]|uniref:ABC transporter permease subunit n=1 Tax=Streptomyces sp. NPDC057539 TaxID=3346159 RepID=UPI00369A8013